MTSHALLVVVKVPLVLNHDAAPVMQLHSSDAGIR